jgi:flagellar motor protein MotB
MPKLRHIVVMLIAALSSAAAIAQSFLEVPRGEAVERHLTGDDPLTQWTRDADDLELLQSDTLETREVAAEQLETVKLTGLVPPIRFASGVADIPDSTVEDLREILDGMRDRRNVRLHLVGHADNQPLSSALAEVFGDNEGLSRERAGEVAEFLQNTLTLPAEAVSYEWAGDSQPIASNDTLEGRALNRRVEVEIWYDEVAEGVALEEFLVERPINRIKVCRTETVCKLRYVDGHERRARVQNLIAPLHYDDEAVEVTDDFVGRVRQALDNMSDKQHVVVRFVGFTDDTPLAGRNERIYGTHVGLSSARARRVALAVQDALGLQTEAVESEGRGTDRPVGSNDTSQGRALNRRVEVEFWYDDPLQDLPDEPMLCPMEGDGTRVARVYDPPWGEFEHVTIDGGQPQVPASLVADLRRALDEVASRMNVRVRFVGYTRNEVLDRRTAMVYGDDIGLSAARARRTMESVAEQLGLSEEQVEFEGRGYVSSPDVVNAGFIQGDESYVVAQVVYDEVAASTELDGVDITRLNQELRPQNPFGLNMMRITVDGKPIDDPQRSFSDIQRCTDVALEEADIRFTFDNLSARARLSVSAEPTTVALVESGSELVAASNVRFMMYSNYAHFIERAEVRIFEKGQSPRETPLEVIEIDVGGVAEWTPESQRFRAPLRELSYVLRAYAADGAFDETTAQPLWLTYAIDDGDTGSDLPVGAVDEAPNVVRGSLDVAAPGLADDATETTDAPQPDADGAAETADDAAVEPNAAEHVETDAASAFDPRLLDAYGENEMAVNNIALSSGTVTVQGANIPPGHAVWVAGQPVPVDAEGNFIAETILPTGLHTVEVAVLDEQGNGELFLRDLELERNDWFYVGMADLTFAQNDTNGPIDLYQGSEPRFDYDASSYGRLAFYLNGKFGERWKLAAGADTREEPLDELFSNFTNKSPDALFRRIDPDYHYPTFGDDSVVEEGAPTLGRFYVRLDKGENYGMWGNFDVGYMNNELAQIDRGLYGGTLHYESPHTTSFGEQKFGVDGFMAEPGTIASREEFRGTGGSLYFLRRQDVLTGSERVRIEIRDKASGIVTGVLNLRPVLDYDIDYLQGRILLAEPLSSTVGDDLLVRGNALSGDEAYLVVRYEYSPGFEEIDALSVGGQVHYWVNEHVKIGLTANTNEQGDTDSVLNGTDLTLRKSAQTWFKLQTGQSEGFLTGAVRSDDGGFGFSGYDDLSFASADASANRADISVGLDDFFAARRGRITLYGQELDAGYAAPGLATLTDTRNYGGSFRMPVTDRLSLTLKTDRRVQDQGLETDARELDVGWQLNQSWNVSTGMREDMRRDNSAVVPLTQTEGERRDAVVLVGYDSHEKWSAYGFVQETVATTGTIEENGRFGVGGSYGISERLGLDLEISDGDLGRGGKIGTNYIHSDRTSLYLNYALENERTDNGLLAARGSEGRLVAGAKTRFSDSTSVFVEERYQDNESLTGLTHSAGISFAPTERLNLSANADIGTLQDTLTGAETDRTAVGLQVGYGFDAVQFSSGIEYRVDDAEQPDLSLTTRTTWLFRNNFKYQLTPAVRLLGKLNHSESESTAGQFYDGGYTEAVFGSAYRPVLNDRLNLTAKYTYFENVPTTEQITLSNTAAEFIQKSHITSLDVSYDIKPRWTVGGKYAHRISQASLDRENPEFFDNGAQLLILRTDWEFRKDWEALFETRVLNMTDLGEKRSGSLVVVSRYLGDHVKIGLGYNLTDFSDDLTDLNFDHQGAFLTLTGAM